MHMVIQDGTDKSGHTHAHVHSSWTTLGTPFRPSQTFGGTVVEGNMRKGKKEETKGLCLSHNLNSVLRKEAPALM